MQKITKEEILGILFIILAAVCFWFLARPALASLKETSLQVAAKTIEIDQTQTKLEAVKKLKTEFNVNPDAYRRLQIALPSAANAADIIVQIEALAQSSGVEVSSFVPSAAADSSRGSEFNLSIKGGYSAVANFLKNTENNLQPLGVKSLSLAGGSNASLMSGSLVVEVFTAK